MIPATILLLAVLWLHAWEEAEDDAETIANHGTINHGRALAGRVAVGALCWACAALAGLATGTSLSPILLLIPAGWAWWTMLFRWTLNRARGLDWWYISPSNWYDWQFLRQFTFGKMQQGEWIDSWPVWGRTESARRAGTLAYAFEAAVFIASIACAIWAAFAANPPTP